MTEFLIRCFVKNSSQVNDPKVREQYGLLSGGIGIVLNLLLAGGKCLAGLIAGSIAIMADAFNNLSDAGSSVVTLVGFRLAGQKADEDHPFGHGRIEYLAGLLVSLIILVVGLELAKSSVEKILHPEEVAFSTLSAAILVGSILIKLWMGLFNRRLSKHIGSVAMAATAADSLSDVAATSAVLLSLVVSSMTGLHIDGWAGILVSVFILRAGWGAAKDTLNPLLGQNPDPELVQAIQQTVLSHPNVVGMHDLIIHDYGPGRRMCSFHAEVPMDADIMEAHDQIDHIEREIKEQLGVEASAHLDPIATQDEEVRRLREQVAQLVGTVDPSMSIHDFRMTSGPHHTNLIFDIAASHQCALSDKEVCQAVERLVKEKLGERYFTVLQVDRVYTPPEMK